MPNPLSRLLADRLDWDAWERLLHTNGYTLDRPYGTAHPRHPDIVYPIDYGYLNGTHGGDGEAIDVFVGSADTGLVGALLTTDHRKGDREAKLLYHCSPEEVYLANGFINFDRSLMEGILVLRQPMRDLWARCGRG